MEEVNNFPPLDNYNDNFQNNMNQNNPNANDNNSELKGDDFQIIIFNLLPSSFYIIIINALLLIGKDNYFSYIKEGENEDLSQADHLFVYLKFMIIIYSLYIFKAFFYYFNTTNFNIENKNYKIIISLLYLVLDLFYFFFTYGGYKSYQRLSLNFIIYNLKSCIFIYALIFIGIVHICLAVLSFFYMILFFVFSLNAFSENEIDFIVNQGELPEILDQFLISQKADKNHCNECIICLNEIEEGQDIIILRCSQLHYFHSYCIKKWFRNTVSCPICRKQLL